jgi:hypothetical protein
MAVGSGLRDSGEGIGGCGVACSDDDWIVMGLSPCLGNILRLRRQSLPSATSGSYCFQRLALMGVQFLGQKRHPASLQEF